jgi:hypothetical protein
MTRLAGEAFGTFTPESSRQAQGSSKAEESAVGSVGPRCPRPSSGTAGIARRDWHCDLIVGSSEW